MSTGNIRRSIIPTEEDFTDLHEDIRELLRYIFQFDAHGTELHSLDEVCRGIVKEN